MTVMNDATVVPRGRRGFGGNSSNLKEAMIGVDTNYSTDYAFAALVQNQTLVTWDEFNYGGDSSRVKTSLIGVDTSHATSCAVAGVLDDATIDAGILGLGW